MLVVPDLNGSIDFDSLLLGGAIEDSELHDDTATGAYCPSAQALGQSIDATNTRCAKRQPCMVRLMNWNCFTTRLWKVKRQGGGAEDAMVVSAAPHGQSISNRHHFLGNPAGHLTTMREIFSG